MSPKTWLRVKLIVYHALEKAPEDRQKYLRDSCQGNDEVLNEVRSLLETSREAEDFIEVSVQEYLRQELPRTEPSTPQVVLEAEILDHAVEGVAVDPKAFGCASAVATPTGK